MTSAQQPDEAGPWGEPGWWPKMEAQPGTVLTDPGGSGGASAQPGSRPVPAQRKGAENHSAPAQPRMEHASPAAGEVPVHAEIGLTRPSRERGDPAQPGTKRTGPAGILPWPAQPGFCCTGSSGIGRDRPGNLLCRPGEAKFAACQSANMNSGQEKLYSGRGSYMSARGMPKSTPDPYMPAGT
jgi:hypothetical protein